jgi:hypothetical protein
MYVGPWILCLGPGPKSVNIIELISPINSQRASVTSLLVILFLARRFLSPQ